MLQGGNVKISNLTENILFHEVATPGILQDDKNFFITRLYFQEGPTEGEFSFSYSTRGTEDLRKRFHERNPTFFDMGNLELVMNFSPTSEGGTYCLYYLKSDIILNYKRDKENI